MTDAPSIHVLMAKILAEMPAVPKSGTAPANQGGYKFRRIEDTIEALRKPFIDAGVYPLPTVIEWRPSERIIASGKTMYAMTLLIRWTFHGPAGDSVEAVTLGEGTDMGDKATQKATTAAFKSCLSIPFLVTDGTDSESHDVPDSYRPQRRPPVPEGMVLPGAAKKEILTAVGGDMTKAAEVWGDRGSNPIDRDDLDEIIAKLVYSGDPF